MFNSKDLEQIKSKGIDIQKVKQQIENFKKGFPEIVLTAPATIENGIKTINEKEAVMLSEYFDHHALEKNIIKFVPASGAASRMFKHLHEYIDAGDYQEEILKDKDFNSVHHFLVNIKTFAFFDDLKKLMKDNGHDIEECLDKKDYATIIEFLLLEKGLNYSKLPKGLLKFHKYLEYSRTPIEEHLVEGANLCRDENNSVRIHFTVSDDHMDGFRKHIEDVRKIYETKHNVNFSIEFSIQKPSTDTIAVDMDNKPFRDEEGKLVFRPGGHGALIENLNDTKAEMVFIKNIDNVIPDKLKSTSILYKKVIGGYLIKIQDKVNEYLNILEKQDIESSKLNEIRDFAEKELYIGFCDDYNELSDKEKAGFLYTRLNRPMRVCGMVKNEGEPGGGPFFVRNSKGEVSLQIIEGAQINNSDTSQKELAANATHFNPVDIVCNIRNYKGIQYELADFIDHQTGIISKKSFNGKDLKAQELPGLWNGAMADWITVFVEIPLITFNPVKTVNDLLREQHR